MHTQQKFRAMQRTEEKKTNKPTNKWNTEYKTNYLKPNKENTNQKFNKEYFEAWRQAQQANRKEKTETKFKNDIFKEKSYQLLYERLRNGKMQRELKDAVNDRYGYEHNDNLKEYIKKEKEQKMSIT